MASSSFGPPSPGIEWILMDIAVFARSITTCRKEFVAASPKFLEAKAAYKEAKAAYIAASDAYRVLKNDMLDTKSRIQGRQKYYQAIADKYQNEFCTYASSHDQQGLKCTTVEDVYRCYILKKYGNYTGAVYIDEARHGLIEAAHDLKLEPSSEPEAAAAQPLVDPPQPSVDVDEDVQSPGEMASSSFGPPSSGIELILMDIAEHALSITTYTKDFEQARPKFLEAKAAYKEAKAAYIAACHAYRILKNDMLDTKSRIQSRQKYCQAKVDKYQNDFCTYASSRDQQGLKCTTVEDVYRCYILKRYGNYTGAVYIDDARHDLIEAAHDLQLEPSNEPEVAAAPQPSVDVDEDAQSPEEL